MESENFKEEYSITPTEFLKVKLAKLRESSEDADKVVSPVLKEAASLCSQMESTSVTFSNVKILQTVWTPFPENKKYGWAEERKEIPLNRWEEKNKLEKECRELLAVLNPSGGRKNRWNGCEAILMSCVLT